MKGGFVSMSCRSVRAIVLGIVLFAPSCLATLGCGGKSSEGPPSNVGSKKTPSEILKEAKEQAPKS
jgi:hypothetical protein